MPDLTVPIGGEDIRAYLATPAVGEGPWPGAVVIHDAVGMSDVTRIHADTLAAAGYVAIVPDLYSRGGMCRCVVETMRSLLRGRGRPFDDIDGVRRWLLDRSDCAGGVGIIGFCMGGGFALMTANRGFQVSAPNYGMLPKDLDAALEGACPIVASYGARDRAGMKGSADRLEKGLAERGIPHDVKEYPDVGHSFLDRFNAGPFTPLVRVAGLGYDHAVAEDAWRRILRFFAEHVGA
jgi:carboxymethylenebutenolidase